jgi:hypothetical protein
VFVNLAGLVQIASLPSILAGKVKVFPNALMEEHAPVMATRKPNTNVDVKILAMKKKCVEKMWLTATLRHPLTPALVETQLEITRICVITVTRERIVQE